MIALKKGKLSYTSLIQRNTYLFFLQNNFIMYSVKKKSMNFKHFHATLLAFNILICTFFCVLLNKDSMIETYKKMWRFMENKKPSVFVSTYEEGIQRVLEGSVS